jgi:glutamate/tyrosine decarboxylase-like PLP-dependent enzyme
MLEPAAPDPALDVRALLHRVADDAGDWFAALPERPVRPARSPAEMAVADALPDRSTAVEDVIADLVRDTAPGLTAMGSPRYYGFVVGGAQPVGVAADWLVTAWDQNTGLTALTPALAAVEAVAGAWVLDVLRLPADASFAFVTGCQMAHVTALAAARHRVLATAGHDVERDGLAGAPPIRVLAGEERHVTLDRALRFLGLGAASLEPVAVDGRGAMRADALRAALGSGDGRPTIVAAQVGNVNTGAIDPMAEVCAAAHDAGAWVHVDGAFGLWAAASPARRDLVRGVELADSWTTDAHKWLNVPYDSGIAVVRDTEAHRAAMSVTAAYLVQDPDGPREPLDWTPEFSRRARGVAVYATLRALGRSGVADLVDRLCDCAERFAARLAGTDGFDVLAQDLNQVLVRVGDDDAETAATLAAAQAEGTCWPSGTTWRGRTCIRLSVCSWQTTAADIDRSVDALVRAAGAARAVARSAPHGPL